MDKPKEFVVIAVEHFRIIVGAEITPSGRVFGAKGYELSISHEGELTAHAEWDAGIED